MKNYYLKILNGIYSADDYELIIQKIMYFSEFYLCDNGKEISKFLYEWNKNGSCSGILISTIKEKFITFSITQYDPIIDLDERKKQEEILNNE